MNNKKKRLLAFSLAFVLASTIISDKLKEKSGDIYFDENIDNPHYIGSCYTGDVYFGSKSEMKLLAQSGIDGIFIVDDRNAEDPNIQIIDSYNINSTQSMKDILKIVKQYDEENPSKWSRTIKSMVNEWWVHNICFVYDYYRGNAGDVDLNNGDQEVFETFNLQRLVLRKRELEK